MTASAGRVCNSASVGASRLKKIGVHQHYEKHGQYPEQFEVGGSTPSYTLNFA